MNFIFISPQFPTNYYHFCAELKNNGVNVLGIGDSAYDSLPYSLKNVLTEYYKVESMENYDQMMRAVAYFTFKYGRIDWIESNNEYWYGLIEGIYLVAVPKKYTGDKAADIVNYTLLYVNKTGEYESDAASYVKHLIKANNNQITDSEIDTLLKEAKTKPNSGEAANNGKGISVGYTENEEKYQYQVLRLYK